ncbi:MAG: DUF1801 domain-containing protein [Acidimicrobiia bacterium]|jgi:hypothetical protein
MAESAGIVNEKGRSQDHAFRRLIEASPPAVKRLSLATRDLVYDVFPATIEVVWPTQGSVGWGVGPRKLSEQFAYCMPFTKHVTLGFYRGRDLPDPEGLLPEGTGRQGSGKLSMRSLRITDVAQLDGPALRQLVESAARERGGVL